MYASSSSLPLLHDGNTTDCMCISFFEEFTKIPSGKKELKRTFFRENSQKFQVPKKKKKELNFKKIQVPKKRKKEMHTPLPPTVRKMIYLPRMPTNVDDFLHINRVRRSEQDRLGLIERFAEMLWSRFRPPRDCYRPIKKLKKILKLSLVKKSQKTGLKSIKKLVLEIPPLPPQQLCFICNSSAFMLNYVNT